MTPVALAAKNNALWCDAVCRAHGRATEVTDDLWACFGEPPRFYPAAATLRPGAHEAIGVRRPAGFKDGFDDVDGESMGYRRLFRAAWLWRDPMPSGRASLDWRRVSSDEALLDWETAWVTGDEEAARRPRQFPPGLLGVPGVTFLAGLGHGMLKAGCILFETDPVVGLSNAFALEDGFDPWPDFAWAATTFAPGLPVVGYEQGAELGSALACGFRTIGSLSVWIAR